MGHGRLDEYAFQLREKYGEKILDYLQEKKREVFAPKVDWMIEQTNLYRTKIMELENAISD